MRQEPRIVLLTGSERRHRYAATAVAERTAVVGIVTEEGGLLALGTSSSPEDRETIRQHLAERDAVEARMLGRSSAWPPTARLRSEEHTSELQSHSDLVCRLLLEKKKEQTK